MQNFKSPFSNLSPEFRFIITGIFYISILNILPSLKIFDLFTFFAIYACYKHLKSKPNFNDEKIIISGIVMNLYVSEAFFLVYYIMKSLLTTADDLYNYPNDRSIAIIISFFLFIPYFYYISVKEDPDKVSQIIRNFLKEYYQFFLLLICYIFITKAVITKHCYEHIAILVVISFMIFISTNILNKKCSLFLEILGFSYLFFVFTINFMMYFHDREKFINNMHLSIDNNIAILFIFINIFLITLILLINKTNTEKAKIFLFILLIISLFIPDNSIFCFIFYITSSIILPILIIYYKKLSIFHAKIFFLILNAITILISMPATQGRGGYTGSLSIFYSSINFPVLLIIIFISNHIEKKKLAKNNIIS
jgi:hypothetical protein